MHAVIFKARVRELDQTYHETVRRMRELALREYGCLEFLSVTEGDREISVSYWNSLEDIERWKHNAEHLRAQALAGSKWYSDYQVEVVEIVRAYGHGNTP